MMTIKEAVTMSGVAIAFAISGVIIKGINEAGYVCPWFTWKAFLLGIGVGIVIAMIVFWVIKNWGNSGGNS